MDFEWDPAKDAANQEKHGISFGDAITVFRDPHHLSENSSKPEHGEERFRAIGMVALELTTVVYTNRGDRRRIISARKVRKDERERYRQSTNSS